MLKTHRLLVEEIGGTSLQQRTLHLNPADRGKECTADFNASTATRPVSVFCDNEDAELEASMTLAAVVSIWEAGMCGHALAEAVLRAPF